MLGYWRELSIAAGAVFLALAAGVGVLGVYLIRQIRLRETLERDLLGMRSPPECSSNSHLMRSSPGGSNSTVTNRRRLRGCIAAIASPPGLSHHVLGPTVPSSRRCAMA